MFKWTEQGIKDIRQAPARIEQSVKQAADLGSKLLGVYVTMGEYDLVSIVEWPSDEAAAITALAIGSGAFGSAEFAGLVKKLP